MTEAEAQQFLETNFAPWVLDLKPRVTAIGPEGASLRIPIGPHLLRTGGILSGQAVTALADTAMVLACGGHAGEMIPVGTVTLDTQFLRPASGEALIARAEVTRAGRSVIFARAELTEAPSGKTVALATATFAR